MAVVPYRLRALLSVSTTLYLASILFTSRTIHNTLLHLFSPRTHPLRLLALLTAIILNLKSFPLVWHIRLFGIMLHQLYRTRPPMPKDALFRPIIMKGCQTTLPETDYNMHKSNSTYFADFDISRTMLVVTLMRKSMREQGKYAEAGKKEVEEALVALDNAKLNGVDAGAVAKAENAPVSRPEQPKRRKSFTEKLKAGIESMSEVAKTETMMGTPGDTDVVIPNPSNSPTSKRTAAPREPADAAGAAPAAPATQTQGNSKATAHPTTSKKDRFLIALGGVSTTFHRELKPYEPYDVWTRILTWDRKWIYFVSHMVKAGAGAPDDCALQPEYIPRSHKGWAGKTAGGKAKSSRSALESVTSMQSTEEWRKSVFASSIARYVVKKGRLTIPPEIVWSRSDLLPGEGPTAVDESGTAESNPDPYAWTWRNVERERKRGWDELASHFAELEKAGAEWPVSWGGEDKDEGDAEGGSEVEGSTVFVGGRSEDGNSTKRRKINVLGAFGDWLSY